MKINSFNSQNISTTSQPKTKKADNKAVLPQDSIGRKERVGDDKMKKLADMAARTSNYGGGGDYGDNWLGPIVDLGIATAIGLGAGAVGGAMLATGIAASILCGTAGAIVGGAAGAGVGMAFVNHKFNK